MHNKANFYLPGVEVRVATDGTSRTLVGLIPYGKPSAGLMWQESIAAGAFASALAEGADVLALRDHKQELLLARTLAGTLQLRDTSAGLQFTITLPNTSTANDLIESISRKDITGVSFGFICNKGGDQWAEGADGVLTRTLLDVTLLEISVTSFAAYPDASVALRGVPSQYRSRLRHRQHEARTNAEGCDCPCSECAEFDNCSECENEECDFDCPDCPNQLEWEDRTRLRLRIEVMRRQ